MLRDGLHFNISALGATASIPSTQKADVRRPYEHPDIREPAFISYALLILNISSNNSIEVAVHTMSHQPAVLGICDNR